MKKRWKDVMAGFVIGILVFLVGNVLLCRTDENAGEYLSKMQEVQQGECFSEEETQRAEDKSEASKAADKDTKPPQGFRISRNMEIPQGFIEEIMLYQYIEYGVRKCNEDTGKNNRYSVDIHEDMLPYGTEFAMKTAGGKPYKTDLAKELLPKLSDNIFNFILHGQDETKYISIDTYNMKIYLYDMIVE